METTNNNYLPLSVIIAGVLIAGAVLWNGAHPSAAPQAQGGGAAPSVNIKDIKTADHPFVGNTNAKITIAFWSDFQCPFCKQFELNTLPQIMKEYVDTGKAKVVFMDFAFLGADSTTAGEYSRAVWKLYPSAYFAWRTAMYTAQDDEGDKGFGDAASIDKLNATVAGIDATAVALDVKAHASEYLVLMEADKQQAQKAGLNATPAFVIGKQTVLGAQPYANFKTAIDAVR